MKKRICFILNPNAGHGIHDRVRQAISKQFTSASWEIFISLTEKPGHATQLSEEAVAAGFDAVVAAGGDGTVNEVATALKNRPLALGIVPTGSGNGLARHFKIPLELSKALAVIAKGNTRRIDNLLVNGQYCLNLAGAGFDAYVAGLFAKGQTRGFYSYLRLVVTHYFHYAEKEYRIAFSGKEINRKALLVALCNGSQFGNGASIASTADPTDGLLNLVILRKIPFYSIPSAILSLFTGNLAAKPFAEQYLANKVRLACDTPMDTHIDGEPAAPATGWEVVVEPKTTLLLIP